MSGQYKPGQSGNPSGTSRGQRMAARTVALKIQEETRDLAEVTEFALAVLRWNPTNAGTFSAVYGPIEVDMKSKRWAAEFLMARGAGKPLQVIEFGGEGAPVPALVLKGMTEADLDAAERVLRESGAGELGDGG